MDYLPITHPSPAKFPQGTTPAFTKVQRSNVFMVYGSKKGDSTVMADSLEYMGNTLILYELKDMCIYIYNNLPLGKDYIVLFQATSSAQR